MAFNTDKKTTLGHLQSAVSATKNYVDKKIEALPADQFLDQAKTKFVYSFTWSTEAYPGSSNPNLNGKAVLVMAVKGQGDAVSYSFLDLSQLIDVNKIDKVSGAGANNLPKLNSDGTLADSGIAAANVLTTADVATNAEVSEMLAAQFPSA